MLAGCGGGAPRLARSDAAGLIALAHRIGVEPACAQAEDIPRLRTRAIALVNAGRVPAGLQEPLLSGVAALGEQTPVCLPKVPASAPAPTTTIAPGAAPTAPRGEKPDHGKGPKHGHGHGHGK